ncbi:MAG: site-2 protease family protein [Thermoplasmata archaeon]|nr:site-2 protease family protein [Thermoplasmata archaeon]
MNGLLVAIALISLWVIFVYLLHKYKKIKGPLSLMGPALMVKTKKGKSFIENIGKSKFWRYYGDFSILLSFLIMIFVFLLLLWQAYIVMGIPPSQAPSPQEAIGIPGINPIIPVGYGIFALVVAIVFHEFSHGFQIAFHKLKILSLGILLFIVPIGAFVEPDEDELKKTKRRYRMRVFAAGPITNILLAIVMLLLLMSLMSGVTVKYPGLYVASNFSENPNYGALPPGAILMEINGMEIKNYEDYEVLLNSSTQMPGEKIDAKIYYQGVKNVSIYSGMVIVSVVKGYPAYQAGIKKGGIIYSINGTVIRNRNDFLRALNLTHSNQRVEISVFYPPHRWYNTTVILGDKYSYYEKYAPQLNKPYYRGKGFLGISASYLGITVGDANYYKDLITNPFRNAKTPHDYFQATMLLIALPFSGLMPVPHSIQTIYNIPFPGFWIVINTIYWLFWINLMLGMTNLLPAVPLDGGYLFKDLLEYIGQKIKIKQPEKFSLEISSIVSLLILFLIIWQFIGPRI